MKVLLIEIRYPNGRKETVELRDPRETWCRVWNSDDFNRQHGVVAYPASPEIRRASSKSRDASILDADSRAG